MRAGRRHDPLGMHLDEAVRRRERHHRSLVDADRRVASEDLDPFGMFGHLALVAEDHPLATGRRRGGGGAARLARADDEHVAVQMSVRAGHDRPAGRRPDPHRRAGSSGRRHRPRPARTDERLVVEADGQQHVQSIEDREHVSLDRRPPALATHPHPVGGGRDARTDAGDRRRPSRGSSDTPPSRSTGLGAGGT